MKCNKKMNRISAKTVIALCLLCLSVAGKAQFKTELYLTDMPDDVPQQPVQQNISRLLTALNNADAARTPIDYTDIAIDAAARKTLDAMWEAGTYRCGDTEIVERCLTTPDNKYQVRNIPLFTKGVEEKDEYQEAVISFNKQGTITDFHIAISTNLYLKILKKGWDVTDLRYRQMILDYVEQFRTAYNTKDMAFLEQIYSDDALIITGKVIKSVPSEMNKFMPQDKVKYIKQDKRQYLTRLGQVFRNNKRIHVVFDDVKVMKHPAKEGFYGVTLKQGYSSDSYSDIGYLFLLWDFTRTDAPQIHVRTWQPEMLDSTTKLPEEEIFTCDDFDLL